MSRVERFQFEPTCPPGEEPSEGDFEEVEEDETEGRTRIEKRGVVYLRPLRVATNDGCYCSQIINRRRIHHFRKRVNKARNKVFVSNFQSQFPSSVKKNDNQNKIKHPQKSRTKKY